MTVQMRLRRSTNFGLDVGIAFVLVLVLGIVSRLFGATGPEKNMLPQKPAQVQQSAEIRTVPAQAALFTAGLVLETPNGAKRVPAQATLEYIVAIDANEVPDNEALGSYTNSMGGIGKSILKHGGKAYKMTFSYVNVGTLDATYNSGWMLEGQPLESMIVSQEGNNLSYAYNKVAIWAKMSNDPEYAHSHILHPGQKVTETVWFFPCPPVKECFIGDFELPEPIKIRLP